MNLREEHGYTYGASSQFSFRRAAGPFQIASGVRTDVTAPAVSEIFKEVRGMVEKPMSADELQKAKDSLANSLPGAFESSANAVGNFSNVFIYNLGLDYYTRYAEQVNAVTPDQALAVSKKYLVPANMVVIAVGDRVEDRARAAEAQSRRRGDSRCRRKADFVALGCELVTAPAVAPMTDGAWKPPGAGAARAARWSRVRRRYIEKA